tara:strand:- start:568 stop:696 length:129 start_codon:yes stop_codon:yes gene_type:complete
MNLARKIWNLEYKPDKNGRKKKEYGFVDYEHWDRVKQAKKEK